MKDLEKDLKYPFSHLKVTFNRLKVDFKSSFSHLKSSERLEDLGVQEAQLLRLSPAAHAAHVQVGVHKELGAQQRRDAMGVHSLSAPSLDQGQV